MNLSPHFALGELTRNSGNLPNEPDAAQADALRALCVAVLEPIRAHFGPVSIHSGFRSPVVNAATGGAATSQHSKGEAADFHIPGHTCEEVLVWLHSAGLPVDQVIGETRAGHAPFTWIHVSHKASGNRGQYLKSYDGKTYSAWP